MGTLEQLARRALGRPSIGSEEAAYRRLALKGFTPDGIIDVGAYKGDWTRLARRVFTGVPVLMVEPQTSKASLLSALASKMTNVDFVSALLTSKAGQEVTFYEMETGSSILAEQSNVSRQEVRLLPRTLDEVAAPLGCELFLKLDVQGAELEVLKGGACTLARSHVVQLEVATLAYNKGAPRFLDVIKFMDERGFVPFDICGFSRPNGVDTVQVDVIFVPEGSPLRPDRFFF